LKFNTTIITRESEPFKFDNNNIIIQERKKPFFELNTNITRNWNKLLKFKKTWLFKKEKLKQTICKFNRYIFIIQYSPKF
jgi:hypothetical protein